MATKPKKPNPDRHKPSKMVRIPMVVAVALEECAAEDFNRLPDQVLAACREYLSRRSKLPPPNKQQPKS